MFSGCGVDRTEEAASGEVLSQAEAALDGGSVELESNVLKGTVRFTNQNPEILAFLATDPWNGDAGTVTAVSTAPTGFGASTSAIVPVSPSEYRFEMLVGAGAAGGQGVTYNVGASRGTYSFPSLAGVTVPPVSGQPAPTEVTVQGCMGVVQFAFGTDATCQTPVAVRDVYIPFLPLHGSGPYRGFIAGGTARANPLSYWVNTPTGWVNQTVPMEYSVSCDQIVRKCIPVTPPEQVEPGRLTGAFEIHGEPVHGSMRVLFNGPTSGNKVLHGPWYSASDPSSWWTVPNLAVGTYSVGGIVELRSGRNYTYFNARTLDPAVILAGQSTSLTKQVEGMTRHAFDMHPAYFYGAVQLEDPFVPRHPGTWSSLQALFFDADLDSNADGVPDTGLQGRGTYLAAGTPNSSSLTAFPGVFDATRGALTSTYEQVLPGPYDLPYLWTQAALNLKFWSEPVGIGPFTTRPGLYDPARFRYGSLSLRPSAAEDSSALLGPEQRFRIDHAYCFNEVQLQYAANGGRFFNPRAEVSGVFSGTDWRDQPVAYAVNGTFHGTPAVWNMPNPASYAQPEGQISLTLPQGSYTLKPGVSMVSDSGAVNDASFASLGVTLGCGQRLKLVPPLAVSISSADGCAASGTAPVSGQVKSRPAEVDRIWYRLNGGPEVTLCTNCGFDPTFSFNVPLQACGNSIQVHAFSEGMSEPATALAQLVWDDPSNGPSCAGTTCVNRPPVARCRSVTVPADGACSGCGSVDDGSYDPDTGDSLNCVQTPACPYPRGSHKATLTCTDSAGLSSTCEGTVTVRDETPPVIGCADVPVLECSAGGATASFTPSATDNCGAVSSTCVPASGGRFPLGTTATTCIATDSAGLRSSCTFPVTVRDTQPPVLSCPEPLILASTMPEGALVTPGVAVASDTCAPPQVSGPVAGVYPIGVTPVTYTATDVGGNQVTCVSTVQVTDPTLVDPPHVTLCNLPRYTRETHLKACGWATPLPDTAPVHRAYFRVDGGAPIHVTPDLSGGFVLTWLDLTEGTHVVELTATDTRGAFSQKRMTVTVDLTPPVLTVLSPLEGESLASTVVAVTSSVQDVSPTRVRTQWLEMSLVENGSGTVTHTVDLFNRGFAPLLVSATDEAGNTTQRVMQVFIEPAPPTPLLSSRAGGIPPAPR
ncbi:HYR domain-containing protein [Corallococcus terminator]|uniref:HYR domain-containing protein n=1 Tax=Corallococcus terminator TaxID=2316733 RepID=A0A3A8JGB4_9BACT|nr:HYR domain-containing protein [Corallococcus terminator]